MYAWIFAYINEECATQGLPELMEDSNLIEIASQWSEHLAKLVIW